jgi:hypothetical protein
MTTFGHFGRMGVQYSHFLNLAPTLERVKSSIPHGTWRFHFFSTSLLLKLDWTMILISTVGILVWWKGEFTKYSSRIASIMEIFVPFFSTRCVWVCSTVTTLQVVLQKSMQGIDNKGHNHSTTLQYINMKYIY